MPEGLPETTPEIVRQHEGPRPSKTPLWRRLAPWAVVYGLLLAILLFFGG